MALDGYTLRLLLEELRRELLGGRVDRVLQPEKDEIVLLIRQGGKGHRLVLSASGMHPRVHLTKQNKENPSVPPAFCMLLRNRLTAGILREIRQPGLERIAEFEFSARDELGYETILTLRLECMGQRSNLIFTDGSGRILDSIRHVTEEMSRVREVLPGLTYVYPPSQGKQDPLLCSAADFARIMEEKDPSLPYSKAVGAIWQGISPRMGRYMASPLEDGSMDTSEWGLYMERLFSQAYDRLRPCVMTDAGSSDPVDFLPFPLSDPDDGSCQFYDSLSEALDAYFLKKDGQERKRQHTARIRQVLKRNRERCEKKLSIQQQILEDLPQLEEIRVQAELLTTYGFMAQKGASSVTVPNYYRDNEETTIPLDPSKTAQAYAQQLFKKYRKARTAAQMAEEQIEGIESELSYLGELETAVDLAQDEQALREIIQEMTDAKYIRHAASKKNRREKTAAPLRFKLPDGSVIRVGRNPVQNDLLTFHQSSPSDIWFHAQGIPGSHVILTPSQKEPSRRALECAAILAACYSSGKEDSTVSVDYTARKNVRKPSGARPGFVLYQPFQTAIVRPDLQRLTEFGIDVKR